jgi:hypothetical protein
MRVAIAAFVGLVWSGAAVAQVTMPAIPTLEPCLDHAFTTDYRAGVAKQIRGALGADYDLSATVYPAFAAEWAVSLVQGKDGPELVLSDFRQSYWHSGWVAETNRARWDPTAAHALIVTKRHEVPLALAERLGEAWDLALGKVRSYEKNWVGVDGVTYEFRDRAGRCGSAWVPQEKTLPGKLVAIVHELKILAVSRVEPDTTEREQEVLERLALFLREFDERSRP